MNTDFEGGFWVGSLVSALLIGMVFCLIMLGMDDHAKHVQEAACIKQNGLAISTPHGMACISMQVVLQPRSFQ